jgi:molecular chaperone HscB
VSPVIDFYPAVISPEHTFFELFELEESFDIDIAAIRERYRELQNQTHPDRFSSADEAERMQAVQQNSLVNEAYDTLKSPLKRAGYLLGLRGIDTEQASQNDLGMDLLMEQMQLREKLAELPAGESALAELDKMKQDVKERLQGSHTTFAKHFGESDLQAAKKTFFEMQFLQKLHFEIEQSEEQRLGY